LAHDDLNIAIATRPYIGETVNGDRAQIDWSDDRCRVTLIDGLGHGVEAARASERAATVLGEQSDLSPVEALNVCDRILRGTRGAAVSIATIDLARKRLTFSGIGNVEGRLFQPSRTQRLITYRGIVGAARPSARTFEYQLESTWTLILHTDGVSARFDDAEIHAPGSTLEETAQSILKLWGRERDDATVVIVRPTTS
jgi:serine phosphatase RsbU (regulator of sigma subunit)